MISGINSSNSSELTSRLAEMRERFKSMDTDSDGKVSQSEFQSSMPSGQMDGPKGMPPAGGMQGAPPPPPKDGGEMKNPEDMFSEIDSDGDGYITETENESFLEKMQANMQKMLETYQENSPSLIDYLKTADDTKTTNADTMAAFKKDLQALLEKYGQYDQTGVKSGLNASNLFDLSA